MDKLMKINAVKGLIIGMDEQLNKYFQKDTLTEEVQNVVVDKYYDAIQEQLTVEPEEKKEVTKTIIVNGSKTHTILEVMTYNQIISLALGEVFDDRIYSITCTSGSTSFNITKDMDIVINDGDVFNVIDTSKA